MRRNPPAKWPLPDEIDPIARKTIILCIPDEPHHVAAFRGAMLSLASAYNWQDDPLHTAKDVANVWKDVIDSEGECLNFIQDECGLYLEVNGVQTLIYDAQQCIDANIRNGTLAPGKGGDLGPPASSSCTPYSFLINPHDYFVVPTVVSSGDTLLLSHCEGGSTDIFGAGFLWYCPSGGAYVAGGCLAGGTRGGSVPGDPLNTAPHMSIIAQIGNTYYDIWNSLDAGVPATFVVPAGITQQPVRLLLNTSNVTALTSTGEVWGTLTVCNNSSWCHEFNFLTSDGGWTAFAGPYAAWSNGIGWVVARTTPPYVDYETRAIVIEKAFSAIITKFDVVWAPLDYGSDPGSPGGMQWRIDGGAWHDYDDWSSPHTFNVGATVSTVLTLLLDKGSSGGSYPSYNHAAIQKIRIYGVGTNPFGSSNCP